MSLRKDLINPIRLNILREGRKISVFFYNKNLVVSPEYEYGHEDTDSASGSDRNNLLNLTILETKPTNVVEFVKAFCKKCNKT